MWWIKKPHGEPCGFPRGSIVSKPATTSPSGAVVIEYGAREEYRIYPPIMTASTTNPKIILIRVDLLFSKCSFCPIIFLFYFLAYDLIYFKCPQESRHDSYPLDLL